MLVKNLNSPLCVLRIGRDLRKRIHSNPWKFKEDLAPLAHGQKQGQIEHKPHSNAVEEKHRLFPLAIFKIARLWQPVPVPQVLVVATTEATRFKKTSMQQAQESNAKVKYQGAVNGMDRVQRVPYALDACAPWLDAMVQVKIICDCVAC
eukprot:CAMPEP_0172776666 /NCGR_PEP_ID=MMETSP1074-20121228/200314_1 /TAXON_ID=2916 /ORGANISM="Ceratium fusus, Strain PA161109" /LENGTH=148 /DNA_ID=CAMNT_0013613477 /DNA_START=419 /DNA_END=865 /DNA_ORIENTATION=+